MTTSMTDARTKVHVTLLGRFEVAVDGDPLPAAVWGRRHPAALVKVLALAPGRRLHREQVIDLVWPDDTIERASPKLHKAAHFARKATGRLDAVVLRDDMVLLFPGADVSVDVDVFDDLARAALAGRDATTAEQALVHYGGELSPEDRYEAWAEDRREQLRLRHLDLLRLAGRWDDVVELDPADEAAHVELMRRHADEGDRHAALRQFERLDRVLRRELGVAPSPEAQGLRDRLLAATPSAPPLEATLVGRDRELALVDDLLGRVARGRAGTLLVTGPSGIGKSSLLGYARRAATARGWRAGHGSASAVEAPWPYAAVIEALADVGRRHASLLDGLSDSYRAEIDRVLAGDVHEWKGESSHQRLFVACAELVRLAAGTHGLLLTVDDLHDADDATMRLLHFLARSTVDRPVAILASYRNGTLSPALADTRTSLLTRHAATEIELRPLDRTGVEALVGTRVAEPDNELVDRIAALSGGVPFAVDELTRRAAQEPDWVRFVDVNTIGGIAPATREVLQRVAVVGLAFDTDEFVALSGLPEHEAYDHLDAAISGGVVEASDAGYRFRHGLVRDALLHDVPPHRRRLIHRDAAARLEDLGASPARVGHHLLQAGDAGRAASYHLQAAETAAAVGAYRDALEMLEPIRPHVQTKDRGRLLALRADLLLVVGDPAAIGAYRDALDGAPAEAQPKLRARLARAAIMAGDVPTATAALEGVEDELDAEILLAKAHVAFFTADLDEAYAISEQAERLVLGGERSWQVLDLVSLQGLLAHYRGEWFDRMRSELRRTRDTPEIANTVFDGHLCAAEYMLYGPTPYAEVIELARGMRATAERSGALRAAAFATALIGESALLSGDLDLAERELRDAAALHHDLDSAAGEAHSLQRLAEVYLARGDTAAARAFLHQALPLARWSIIAMHLLQRIHGSLIAAAPDPMTARAEVDRAEAALGIDDWCLFCSVMLSVPAAIACAQSGDLDHAHHHLAIAEQSAKLWEAQAWQGWYAEATGHLARAEGDEVAARQRFADAASCFERAGQPLDTERCQRLAAGE
jgi:DNA-binding SARP family transcriptional activator/tetratricopeptide (TPR) repeat protein